MLVSPVARVYAEALFSIARERSQVDEIGQELHEFLKLTRDEPSIARFLESPVIEVSEKVKHLRDALKGRVLDTVADFLCLLVEKRRANALRLIAEAYRSMADDEAGRERVSVTTATELDPAQRRQIEEMLATKLQKRIAVEERIEPSLLGGAVIAIGDKVYDGSIRNRLNQFRKQIMRSGGYANQG